MLVYRVENSYGEGPYTSQGRFDDDWVNPLQKMADKHNGNTDKWPGPWRDGMEDLFYNLDEARFGCGQLWKLKEWFAGFLKMLHREGFSISVYDVPLDKIIFSNSDKQLAFCKDYATLVCTLPMLTRKDRISCENLSGNLHCSELTI